MTPRQLNQKIRANEIFWMKVASGYARVLKARSVKGHVEVLIPGGWIEVEEVERGGKCFILIADGRTPFGQHYS